MFWRIKFNQQCFELSCLIKTALNLSKHDLSIKYRVASTVNRASHSRLHRKIKYMWKTTDAAECCVICTTYEKLPVQKSEEKSFANSSLGIRIIAYTNVAFSRFSVFVQITGNKIEGERASFYFSNCGTREKRSGVVDAAPGVSGGSETNALELVLLSDAVDIICKLVSCRHVGGGFYVLGAGQHEWHFALVKQGFRFVRIQTLEILMAAELSHIISRNICI